MAVFVAGSTITNIRLNNTNASLQRQLDYQTTLLNIPVPITIEKLIPTLLPSIVIVNSRLGQDLTTTRLGTGFFISPNLLVTAYHVVKDRDVIEISRYTNSRDYESTHYALKYDDVDLLGYDPLIDIAVLRVKDSETSGVPVAWGLRPLVGDIAISIGHPMGYEFTVTKGVVSFVGRRNDTYEFNSYIQTDTSINSGNSGGPLFNDKGEVIGVTQATVGSGGIALIIESVLVEKIVRRIVETKGEVKHASFGVGLDVLDIGVVSVTKLLKDSAASKSGILVGDIIVALDSMQYRDILAMIDYVQEKRPGDNMVVTVIRDNKQIEIPVTLGVINIEDTPEEFGSAAWHRLR